MVPVVKRNECRSRPVLIHRCGLNGDCQKDHGSMYKLQKPPASPLIFIPRERCGVTELLTNKTPT